MRADALGFFWEDMPAVKTEKAEKPKRTPPDRIWEDPNYLPGLQEALNYNIPELTERDLIISKQDEELLYDVEVYPNYFLVSFLQKSSGKVMSFELSDWETFNPQRLRWVMENYCVVGFNSISYDMCMVTLAINGFGTDIMFWATEEIILRGARPADILRRFKCKKIESNHIDLIEVAPLFSSLKLYSGRLHTKRMQDLPFAAGTILTQQQSWIVRLYNVNDLYSTRLLRDTLDDQMALRYKMSGEYSIDLRSKSDAQIAEAVISHEVEQLNGIRPRQPEIEPGTTYRYRLPHFIQFQSHALQNVLHQVCMADLVVGEHGAVSLPKAISELEIAIGDATYAMGIGGLHSQEKSVHYRASKRMLIKERDVVSYYPMIIINQELYPSHLGRNFLSVYTGIVNRRIAAKAAGDKSTSDSLKITINGSFGKLGSKYSVLYAPDLLIQVTITGQLALLMLIEAMEIVGVRVISANTDGVMMLVPTEVEHLYQDVIRWWEAVTRFTTEEENYSAVYSRDVNNYIGVKVPDKEGKVKTKTKGAFANPWSEKKLTAQRLHKNPTNQICVDAIEAYLIRNVPIEQTIKACTDITKFVSIRNVKGGAVVVYDEAKDKPPVTVEYLGKSIRWYYAKGREGYLIVYALNGNMVPKSQGAKPCMDLPDRLPSDIDYEWYIEETAKMLASFGLL